MPTSANIGRLTVVILFCLALGIGIPQTGVPATSDFTPYWVIDSGGSRIASIFYGLTPDPRFASQLALSANRKTRLEGPSARFQTLAFRNDQGSKCLFVATAFREPRPVAPRPGSCNGQYMVPQWSDCTYGCDPDGGQYEVFYNNGTEPCNGYYYPHLIGDCGGCVLAERWCPSC